MHLVTKNILTFQEVIRDRINSYLTPKNYRLVTNEWDKEGIQTMLCQWSNLETSDTFQLAWDIKEQWFNLGYFNRLDNLNYRQAEILLILPVQPLKLFRRMAYANRKADTLIAVIEERISATKEPETN